MMRAALLLLPLFIGSTVSPAVEISSVLAHPIFGEMYSCSEHWLGALHDLGDALGTDCFIEELVTVDGRTWMRAYQHDGRENADWYGWHKDVLSPCTCQVVKINVNPVVNRPGVMGQGRPSFVALKRDDGVFFLLAHVTDIRVTVGVRVERGQAIARVGNNGQSRQPHIHIGAWKGKEPLQIRFDQAAMAKLLEK